MAHSVYFILNRRQNAIKIGTTINIATRLRVLQTSQSEALELIGAVDGSTTAERHIHFVLRRYRIKGEWFTYSPDVQRFVLSAITRGLASAVSEYQDKHNNASDDVTNTHQTPNTVRFTHVDVEKLLHKGGFPISISRKIAYLSRNIIKNGHVAQPHGNEFIMEYKRFVESNRYVGAFMNCSIGDQSE